MTRRLSRTVIAEREAALRAATALQARVDAALAPYTEREFLVLSHLRYEFTGLPLTELARRIGVTSGGMTKVVDTGVGHQVVERIPSPHDRRVIFGQITAHGEREYERLLPLYVAAVEGSER